MFVFHLDAGLACTDNRLRCHIAICLASSPGLLDSSNSVFCSPRILHLLTLFRFVSKCGRETAEGAFHIYGLISLDVYWFIDATMVFGGRALTTTGMGKLVENVWL